MPTCVLAMHMHVLAMPSHVHQCSSQAKPRTHVSQDRVLPGLAPSPLVKPKSGGGNFNSLRKLLPLACIAKWVLIY